MTTMDRIAAVMNCAPADGDDLVEAVRLLVAERDEARADRDYWREQATGMAPCVDGMRALCTRLFPGGTGCIVDPERVVAEVDSMLAAYDRLDTEASQRAGEYAEAVHGVAARLYAAEAECARLRAAVGCAAAVLRHAADGMALDHAFPALAGVPAEIADALRALVADRDTARAEADALRAQVAVIIAERDDARMMTRCCEENWRAARAEGDAARRALSAIAEGADVPCLAERVGAQECTAEEPCVACLAGDRAGALRADLASSRAPDTAARAYLAAVDARDAAEAAWMNAKSGRAAYRPLYAAQEHALVCRGAMRDARAALVKALVIQPIVK